MCFGGRKKSQNVKLLPDDIVSKALGKTTGQTEVNTTPQPVTPQPIYIPESRKTVVPILRLNEDEEKVLKLKTRKKRLGTRKLQIPLTPTNPGTGLGIPGRSIS